MKNSIMYQDIFEEGEAAGFDKGFKKGRIEVLMRFGVKRWGQPDAGEKAVLEAITDGERIDRMFDRVVESVDALRFDGMIESANGLSSWNDLLQIQ